MKIFWWIIALSLPLLAGKNLVVFENEYNVLELEKPVKRVTVGNRDLINVTPLHSGVSTRTLKIFGKKTGNTSLLIVYGDNSIDNFHIYINQNLGFVEKMLNVIAPEITLQRMGDGSTVLQGDFESVQQKRRVMALLESANIKVERTLDITRTAKVAKMVRSKLYLVEIDNNKAEELGGATGLNFVSKNGAVALNPAATTYATFSGWLLDNSQKFAAEGESLIASLNFMESKGVARIVDDTVLMTTEEQNASFHVGGDVYIPVGMTYNIGYAPTVELEEREYGLRLTMTPHFVEQEGYMNISLVITDSEFDTDPEHQVQLGQDISVPAFISKNITTDIMAKSGEVIALGGRMHLNTIQREEKIPILGDIPLLGWMFSNTVDATRGKDLVFFLVPEIIDSNQPIDDTNFLHDFRKERDRLNTHWLDSDKQDKKSEEEAPEKKPVAKEEKTSSPAMRIIGSPEPKTVTSAATVMAPATSEAEEMTFEESDPIPEAPEEEIVVFAVPEATAAATAVETVESEPVPAETAVTETVRTDVIAIEPTRVETLGEDASRSEDGTDNKPMHEVSVAKVFLRSAPLDGERVDVWGEGHRFKSDTEKSAGGIPWLRIVEDCKGESCKPLDEPAWIAKKFTGVL